MVMRGTQGWANRVLLAAVVALAACSPGQADSRAAPATAKIEQRHRLSNLQVVPLTVSSARRTHAFRVEVARTAAEQARGLMHRTAMGADEGMVFIRNPPDRPSFWMRNTLIPLDIIFIGIDGRILNIAQAVPLDETPVPSAGIAGAVLELNGGRAAELGIRPGDRVRW